MVKIYLTIVVPCLTLLSLTIELEICLMHVRATIHMDNWDSERRSSINIGGEERISDTDFLEAAVVSHIHKCIQIHICMHWYRGSCCMELLPADHAAALGDLLGEIWDGRCTAALRSRSRVNIMRDMFMLVGLERGRERGGYARRSLRSAQNGPNPSHVRMKNSMCRKSSAGGQELDAFFTFPGCESHFGVL
jgi:hypothetical protein